MTIQTGNHYVNLLIMHISIENSLQYTKRGANDTRWTFNITSTDNCILGQRSATLENLAHGRVRLRARGRIAKFRCFRKYKLFGAKILICSGDKWSLPPPVCIRQGCDDIQSSENLTVTRSYDGAVLDFTCASPLQLTGEKLITCDGTTWSNQVPTCEYLEPENYCDFEDENICGWQHDEQANFEWKWNSGTTPTQRTGPTYDHTLGQSGNEVGRLKVYIKQMGQTGTLSQQAAFQVSGNQGDEWIKAQFPVGEQTKSIRFIIEGQKLKSYLSDIAVDDPKLYNCSDGTWNQGQRNYQHL